jgi:hypothetical protein
MKKNLKKKRKKVKNPRMMMWKKMSRHIPLGYRTVTTVSPSRSGGGASN